MRNAEMMAIVIASLEAAERRRAQEYAIKAFLEMAFWWTKRAAGAALIWLAFMGAL